MSAEDTKSAGLQLWELLDTLDALRKEGVEVRDPKGTGKIVFGWQVLLRVEHELGISRTFLAQVFKNRPVKQVRAITRWVQKEAPGDKDEQIKMLVNWSGNRGNPIRPELYHIAMEDKEAC